MKILVYGTLKESFGNNYLLKNCRLVGTDILVGVKLFYSYNKGSFPVAHVTNNPEDKVMGEVYDLTPDPECIRRLDALEGVPHMYKREVMTTESYKTVYTYIGNDWNFNKMLPVEKTDGVYIWNR